MQWAVHNLVMNVVPGTSDFLSAWAVWPAGEIDPLTETVMPIDETLVRVIDNFTCIWHGVAPTAETPIELTFGLIAFDGGSAPEAYEQILFSELDFGSIGCPPHPVLEADDDWIIRLPFLFVADATIQQPAAGPFIESKAMRKLPPGKGILAVVSATALSAAPSVPAPTFSWMSDVRLALKSGAYAP